MSQPQMAQISADEIGFQDSAVFKMAMTASNKPRVQPEPAHGKLIDLQSASSAKICGPTLKAAPSKRRGLTKAEREARSAYPKQPCAECLTRYKPLKKDQSFCCDACKKAFHNRRQRYGSQIFDLAVAWRRKRQPGSYTAFCRQLDQIIRDHGNELGHAVSDGRAGFGRMSTRKS